MKLATETRRMYAVKRPNGTFSERVHPANSDWHCEVLQREADETGIVVPVLVTIRQMPAGKGER